MSGREPWWVWHWDKADAKFPPAVSFRRITRWRRGSLLTVYRFVQETQEQWWFYGPFDLAIGFGFNRKNP
jgi:hypothetical protein